jgi:hypothetical protein
MLAKATCEKNCTVLIENKTKLASKQANKRAIKQTDGKNNKTTLL